MNSVNDTANEAVEVLFACLPSLYERFIRRYERSENCVFTRLQGEAMELIKARGCLAMHEIAEQMNMSKQQLTRFVDTLVKKGALTRYNRENDRRTIYIELTEEGERLLTEHRRLIRQPQAEVAASMTPEEQKKLLSAAGTLKELLEKYWGNEE